MPLTNGDIVKKLKNSNSVLKIYYRKQVKSLSSTAFISPKTLISELIRQPLNGLYKEVRSDKNYYAIKLINGTGSITLVMDTVDGILKDEYSSFTGDYDEWQSNKFLSFLTNA